MSQPLRIFISSPGDVNDERRRAALVITKLKREFSRFFDLSAVLWEYEAMTASGHFQDIIERPSNTDIVVVILWSRLGTPLPTDKYQSPLDERVPVTGTEWEYEEALKSSLETKLPEILVYKKLGEGIARFSRKEQLDQARMQWEALESFWTRYFVAPDGSFKTAFNSFKSLDEFEEQLEAHLRQMLRQRLPEVAEGAASGTIVWHEGSPFRGLEVFDLDHAKIFFGRERAEREVTEALVKRAGRGCAFLLVLGASGIGKSSLVRAGVLPNLMAPGVVERVDGWRHVAFRPGEGGGDLFDGLARALVTQKRALPELEAAGIDAATLAEQWRGNPAQAALPLRPGLRLAAMALPRSVEAPLPELRLVVVADQLEELFSLRQITPEHAAAFVRLLEGLARGGVWVIATLRSDFYHRCVEIPELAALAAGEGSYHLAPPGAAEITQMIQRPAEAAGLRFETATDSGLGLDAVLQEAAARDAASLPLLEFALDELYRRDVAEKTGGGSVLTFATYRTLGGLEGAIGNRAESECAALPAPMLAALPSVLRALVTIGDDSDTATARTAPRGELASTPERAFVTDQLLKARLLVGSGDESGATVRVAHEALLSHWPRYAELIEHDRDFLRARGRVAAAERLWRTEGRDTSRLLPEGNPLAEGERLLRDWRAELEPALIAYIESSTAEAQRRRDAALLAERKKRKVMQRLAAVAAMLALAAGGAGWLALEQKKEAEKQTAVAVRNFDAAVASGDVLVGEVAERLRPLAGGSATTVRAILERAEEVYQRLGAMMAEPSPDLLQRRATMLMAFAGIYGAMGDGVQQQARAEAALAILDRLAAQHPDDAGLAHQLALAAQAQGDALAVSGKGGDAVAAYRRGQAALKKLAARQPENAGWQRELATIATRLGEALGRQGHLAEAFAKLEQGQELRQRLSAAAPDDLEARHEVADSRLRLGALMRPLGRDEEALKLVREAVAILAELYRRQPSNLGWQRDLATGHGQIAELVVSPATVTAGEQAEIPARAALEIMDRLVGLDPGHAGWRWDWWQAMIRMGEVRSTIGNLADAGEYYRKGLTAIEQLVAADAGNPMWQVRLAISRIRMAEHLRDRGQLDEAVAALREALRVLERLAGERAGDLELRRELVRGQDDLGDLLFTQNQLEGAAAAYRQSLEGWHLLTKAAPEAVAWAKARQRIEQRLQEIAEIQVDTQRPGVPRPGMVFRDCPECPEMVVIPKGSFTMGSPYSEPGRLGNEGPQHRVTIGYEFAVGKYEVTFADWDACVADGGCGGNRPGDEGWGRGHRPVINVSWVDAHTYVQWLSRKTGQTYRLPSEAEWEYTARAGTMTPFWWGSTITPDQANYDGNDAYNNGASGVYRRQTVEVGSFRTNPFGLYDTAGNVWEWVEDCYQ
ncbi:MAG: SUMF1/EgtB/PvdO family nonheme iron enzyme, partial [Rhodospirillaceae bacterium]